MNRIIQIALVAVFILAFAKVKSQDQQFTQFYAAPMYLNPAFAGSLEQNRLAINYRNQWPAIPKSFVSYNVSYDQFFPNYNSGLGISVSHDRAGTGGLSYTSVALNYAYEIRLTKDLTVRPAMQFAYGSTYLDISRLTFSDQLARNDNSAATLDPDRSRFADDPVNYPDFGAGIMAFGKKWWFGASVHHMNEPVQSFLENDSRLPKKLSAHGGIRIKTSGLGAFKRRQFLVPAFNYRAQGLYDQLDLGMYYEYEPISIGLWYRGIPLLKKNGYGYMNHDAIAVLVGYQINNMKIGYSYDLTLSQLTVNSGGAHELSIIMEFINKSRKKIKRRVIPCAKF